MGKVLEVKSKRSLKSKAARVRAIVRQMPKMPSAKSKLLTVLMEESKNRRLTKGEDRELRELLDLVDRQTYWNLAKAIEIEARESANRKMRKTG
jgi:hypothetical protein